MKKGFYYIILLFGFFLLWSCSTQKNTKASRFYHAFNSRYNIYFNGKTSFDEALRSMQESYTESYADMIYMFPISAQPKDKQTTGGAFDRAIDKSNKAIKLHSIKTKPPKKPGWRNDPKLVALQEKEEYNPFLKKCWLLMGQGQFYNADFLQAAATFSYIARHYAQEEDVVAEARLWQSRCYAEMNWLFESEDILKKMNTNGIPAKQLDLYAIVYADYLVKSGEYEEAIPYLKTAIKAQKNKRQRSRMKYLLGQLYTEQEANDLAYKTYAEVIKSNPPYELEFAARIRQTEVFSGTNYHKVARKLQRMARNPKNEEYLDQVYYALGNIYLNHEDTTQAIKNYELAIQKSTRHGMDKAICQIKLGDLYFSMRNYIKAQPCFSGALSIIQKEYKEYKRVAKLSSVLDELVVHAEAVQLQDSLQTLARMPELERLAAIDKIIAQVKKEQEEAKALAEKETYLAEQQSRGTGINRPGAQSSGIVLPTATGESSFYFYNPQTVAQGRTQFQRVWGRRTLEDDWRRRDKTVTTFIEDDFEEFEPILDGEPLIDPDTGLPVLPTTDIEPEAPVSDDPLTREYYIQQLPLTDEDILASNLIIIDGLYHMAMIYKDKLEDLPLSIEAFEELEKRFPENQYLLESYFQIYLMALRREDNILVSTYQNKIISTFPYSDYAIAVADPNYAHNIRVMDQVQDSLYQQTYDNYLKGNIYNVRQNYQLVAEKYPLGKLLPKFMFLEALTYVQEGNAEGFKEALKVLLEKYPDADVSELAGEMLKGVLRGRQMVQGSITGMVWNLRFGGEGELSEADSARTFNPEKNTSYRMVLFYPTGSLDKNQLLFTVAAYNFSNFMVKTLDLTQEEAGPYSMLIISGFYNFEEVIQYARLIYGQDGYATALGRDMTALPISDDNYETLMRGKTLEEYIDFFEEEFKEDAPELIIRWKAHMEEDPFTDQDVDFDFEEEDDDYLWEEFEEPDAGEDIFEDELIKELPGEEAVTEDETAKEVTEEDIPVIEENNIPISQPDSTEVQEEIIPVLTPQEDLGLTLKDIEEIRKRQAIEEELRKEKAREAREEQEQLEKELAEQKKLEQAEILKKQKEEETALLKAKAEREKQQASDRKSKLKQAEAERKAKLKTREQQRKQKEKEYKTRLKQKEKERKEKEKAYQKQLKEREKARRELQKAREAARRR